MNKASTEVYQGVGSQESQAMGGEGEQSHGQQAEAMPGSPETGPWRGRERAEGPEDGGPLPVSGAGDADVSWADPRKPGKPGAPASTARSHSMQVAWALHGCPLLVRQDHLPYCLMGPPETQCRCGGAVRFRGHSPSNTRPKPSTGLSELGRGRGSKCQA